MSAIMSPINIDGKMNNFEADHSNAIDETNLIEAAYRNEIDKQPKNIILLGHPDSKNRKESRKRYAFFASALIDTEYLDVSQETRDLLTPHSSKNKRPIEIVIAREQYNQDKFRNCTIVRGIDTFSGRSVVFNITHKENNPLNNALREAELAGKLEHPHIASIYDCFAFTHENQDYTAYMMGYAFGTLETLNELNPLQRLLSMGQIAQGLKHLHKAGFAHLDIKLSNILIYAWDINNSNLGNLSPNTLPYAKLGDFGNLYPLDAITSGNANFGISLHYFAPEQLGKITNPIATDVYQFRNALLSAIIKPDNPKHYVLPYFIGNRELPIVFDTDLLSTLNNPVLPDKIPIHKFFRDQQNAPRKNQLSPQLREILKKGGEFNPEDRHSSPLDLYTEFIKKLEEINNMSIYQMLASM